jgi:DNA polymerase
MIIHWDFELKGVLDLAGVGSWKYAADERTEMRCAAYAVDNDPPKLWLPGDPTPPEIVAAAQDPGSIFCAHNSQFEIAIHQLILRRRHGWPKIPLCQHRCTMAMALSLALPPKLDLVAEALGLVHQKDKAGQRLMLMMAKPRKPRKDEDPQGVYWFDDEPRLQRLYEYCKQDVEVERELYSQLRPLPDDEQRQWQLDCLIGARGFCVDRDLAEADCKVVEAAAPKVNAELSRITEGAVTSINQVARLKAWLAEHGCCTKTLDKDAVEDLLASEALPAAPRRALELRQNGAQAAAKKIKSLLAHCGQDGRIRGSLRFHGASTGRWAGNGIQPQNLKRPEVEDIDAAVAAVATGDYSYVRERYENPLSVVGDITRSMIRAAPDHTLIGGDFSSVESRVLAWVAGEDWKLDSYRRFDATRDPRDEPYCTTACKIFGVPDGTFNSDSPERKVGKVCDLAFGYQGGLGAWRKFEPARFTDQEVEQFKFDWRAAHPQIKKFWYAINQAALEAVRRREQVIRCGRLLLKCTGSYLLIKLPSDRKLSYPFPRIYIESHERQTVVFKDASAGQWRDCRNGHGAYGGLWTENVVSAISRDLLASALMRLERAGYRVILHIHDEIITECAVGFGSTNEFTELMTTVPSWAIGLPIAAKAWTGQRFCK